MKVSIHFYPNVGKASKKDGLIPMYLRVCFNGSKAESRLNEEISYSEFRLWNTTTMRLDIRKAPLNVYLDNLEARFEYFTSDVSSLAEQNAAAIRDYVIEGIPTRVKRMTLMQFVNEYYQKTVVNNVNCAQGTIKNYRRAVNHLHNFLSHTKRQTMMLEELNFEFASDFKNYLVSNNAMIGKIGMTEVSAATVIKKFRTIFTLAVDQDRIRKNPFKQVKIKTKSPKRERLTVEQIKKIVSLDLHFWPHLPTYRDLFLFSIYTGLAYHDANSLTSLNLETKADGNIKLKLHRQKTEVITECFLPLQAIEIIKNYQKIQVAGYDKILPSRSNQKINAQLKKLAELAGIHIPLSTHIARHSFRQLLAEAEIFDVGVIKRMMGQSRNGDVDEVYYSVTEKALLNAKNKLEEFLTQNLDQ